MYRQIIIAWQCITSILSTYDRDLITDLEFLEYLEELLELDHELPVSLEQVVPEVVLACVYGLSAYLLDTQTQYLSNNLIIKFSQCEFYVI